MAKVRGMARYNAFSSISSLPLRHRIAQLLEHKSIKEQKKSFAFRDSKGSEHDQMHSNIYSQEVCGLPWYYERRPCKDRTTESRPLYQQRQRQRPTCNRKSGFGFGRIRAIMTWQCKNGCGTWLTTSDTVRSKSGKCVPLNEHNFRPHICMLDPYNQSQTAISKKSLTRVEDV